MTLSPNFDLKKELDISLQDTTALRSLCRNVASGMCFTYNYYNFFHVKIIFWKK